MSKLSCFHLLLISSLLFVIQCGPKPVIRVAGSETMHPLFERLEGLYAKANIQLEGGGSKKGILNLIKGSTDIALVSRELSLAEVEDLKAAGNVIKTLIGYDGLAIVVNPANQLANIDKETLRKIFTGEIKNWLTLSGVDEPIQVYARNQMSGTTKYFLEEVLGRIYNVQDIQQDLAKYYADGYQVVEDNSDLADKISADPYAIGYMGMGGVLADYAGKIKSLNFSVKPDDAAIQPTPRNVENRSYRLARGLYIIYNEQSAEHIKDFVDFTLEPKAQRKVLESGYLGSVFEEIVVREKALKEKY